MNPSASHTHERGFTMVVIAALFIAFAVIAAAVVERNTITQQITRRDAAAAQLSKLANAIIEYSVFNRDGSNHNLYPCPANIELNTDDSAFGKGVDDGSGIPDCWDTSLDISASEVRDGVAILNSTDVISGMVPVQTLSQYGITTEDAFDPWNNKIVYVVNRDQTANSPNWTGSQANNPTIGESWSNYGIPVPDFILISYGKDGLGAVKRGKPSADIPCPTNTDNRTENCDGADTNFYLMPTYTASDATTTTYFDDILTYYRQ